MNSAPTKATSEVPGRVVTGCAAVTTEDSVSSTSLIRSAQTIARGAIISRKVAIITDIRICTR